MPNRVAYNKKWWAENRERHLVRKREKYKYRIGPLKERLKEFERQLAKLSEPHAAYIAGLIDGEGTILLHRCGTKTHRNYMYHMQCHLSICNTSKRMIDWLCSVLPSGVGIQEGWSRRPSANTVKPVYRWRLEGRNAASLSARILPYLTTDKKKRAEVIVEFFNPIYTQLTPGRELTEEEKVRRTKLFEKYEMVK